MRKNGKEIPIEVLAAARSLAKANVEVEDEITQVFIAPGSNANRIMLVEVDPSGFPRERRIASALYFNPAPPEIPFPSAVVFVTEEERKARIRLPKEWGSWEKLIPIWSKEG